MSLDRFQGCIPSFHWSAGQVSVWATYSHFYQRNVTCWSLEKIQKRKKLTDLDDKHRVQIHSFFRHIWIFSGSSFYLQRPECGLRPYSSTWEIFQLWAKLRFHDTFQFSAQATKSSCSHHCTLSLFALLPTKPNSVALTQTFPAPPDEPVIACLVFM